MTTIRFILEKNPSSHGFINEFELKQLPAHIGREDFEQKSSSSIKLKRISRSFFTINNDMTIHFNPDNQTHFQFLDEKSEIINVHNNTLYKPIANNYKLKLASYDVIDGIFYSKTFQQKQPVIYDIKVSDMFDNFELPIKRKRKEVPDLICPYCSKKFKSLSLHVRLCKERPDLIRPEANDDGFIPKKRLWKKID